MDESRPGNPPRLPLIIDRPDLAHPVRRAVGLTLTILCWGIWLSMWFVLLTTLGYEVGFDIPSFLRPSVVSLDSLEALGNLIPYALATATTLLASAYVVERFKRRWAKPDARWRPLGTERLAHDVALESGNLARWQQAQVLYVEHSPRGRVINAYTEPPRPADGADSLPGTSPTAA